MYIYIYIYIHSIELDHNVDAILPGTPSGLLIITMIIMIMITTA